MYYFAYGSNMSWRRLRQRVASARRVCHARLPGYSLEFHKAGRDGSAKCDAYYTGKARDIIHGVLFDLDPADKAQLDRIEGVGAGYEEQEIKLALPNGRAVQAFTYVATHLDQQMQPYCWYKTHVVAGALEAGLPAGYTRRLRAVKTLRDPNPRRRARESAVHRRRSI